MDDIRIMDRAAVGWMVRYARKNYWRACAHMDFDDLLQEGRECYYYVLNKYPTAVDRPHIMRLFQLTFVSRMTDLANKKTRQIDDGVDDLTLYERPANADPEQATITMLVSKAPEHIRAVLLIFTDDDKLRQLRSAFRVYRGDCRRETLNQRLCRLAGLDPDSIDVAETFREYFAA